MVKLVSILSAFYVGTACAEQWIRLEASAGRKPRAYPYRSAARTRCARAATRYPKHFGHIRRVLARMQEAPAAGPAHWFPSHIKAKDIEFSELAMKSVFPPRQLMRFTLDRVRYTLDVPVMYQSPWVWPRRPHSYEMELRDHWDALRKPIQ